MARGHRGRIVTRPVARTMVWIGARLAATTISSGATLLATLDPTTGFPLRPFTIVRTRLGISYVSDQAAASESQQGVFSMQVVTVSAAGAGVGSIPTPLTDPDADFHVYQPLFQDFLFASGVGFSDNVGGGSFTTVDSKAMRKVGIDDDIAMVLEQQSALGTVIAVEGRFLIKLH